MVRPFRVLLFLLSKVFFRFVSRLTFGGGIHFLWFNLFVSIQPFLIWGRGPGFEPELCPNVPVQRAIVVLLVGSVVTVIDVRSRKNEFDYEGVIFEKANYKIL